jgi:hypothetical protein
MQTNKTRIFMIHFGCLTAVGLPDVEARFEYLLPVKRRRQTFVLGKTGRMPDPQTHNQFFTSCFHAADGKLRNEWGFMLNIHFEVVCFKKWCRLFENAEQSARGEPVSRIIGKPRLETADGLGSESASAINEAFVNSRHFGDVGVGGDFRAGRQEKANVLVRVLRQQYFKLRKFHLRFLQLTLSWRRIQPVSPDQIRLCVYTFTACCYMRQAVYVADD